MPVRKLTSILLSLLLVVTPLRPLVADDIALPEMGDAAGAVMTPEQERKLGESIMRNVRHHLTIIEDPEIQAYIQNLGYRLAAQGDNHLHQFNFYVIKDNAINAFAVPGGFINVNSGLILTAQTEHELAAVMAHEIAHITQRHIMRIISKSQQLNVPATVAILAALLLGTQNSEIGGAAVAATLAGTAQAQINFTRDHEKEADRIGLGILAHAGYDPNSMPAFFERLQQASRYYEGANAYEFLQTHPVTLNRISDTRNRAAQYQYKHGKDHLEFDLIKAKLRVATDNDPAKSLARIKGIIKDKQYRSRAAADYEYALALMAAGQYDSAAGIIDTLRKNDPDRISYLLAAAQLASTTGKYREALAIYKKGLAIYPNNTPLTIRYCETLIQTGGAKKAATVLRSQLRTTPDAPVIHKLLARAEGESGQPGEAHLAMAQYYYLSGDTGAAIHQLKLAQNIKNSNYYLASRVEARLRELEQEQAHENKLK